MATYGSEVGVEGLNAHFTGGYTTSTHPTSSEVGVWLAEGYAKINLALAKAGYTTPVAATVACYQVIVGLNDLYAAAKAELAVNIGANANEDTRGVSMMKDFTAGLTDLLAGDLTLAGLTHAATAPARRSIRSTQMRHYDGYAVNADDAATGEYT
jgi:hypothetical protein